MMAFVYFTSVVLKISSISSPLLPNITHSANFSLSLSHRQRFPDLVFTSVFDILRYFLFIKQIEQIYVN